MGLGPGPRPPTLSTQSAASPLLQATSRPHNCTASSPPHPTPLRSGLSPCSLNISSLILSPVLTRLFLLVEIFQVATAHTLLPFSSESEAASSKKPPGSSLSAS